MLSIIISSYKPEVFAAVKKNIQETCGIVFEIIQIENPGIMGICEAYNKGGKTSQFDYLLFIHEDIKFETKNWGYNLLKHLQIPNVGIIGIAGGEYVPLTPSGWHTASHYSLVNLIQGERDGSKRRIKTFHEKARKVKAVDGVFISMKKDVFSSFQFDEKLTGYHGYDTEISLRIGKSLQNYVASDMLLEHFSPGTPDKNLFDDNMYIRKKHGSNFNTFVDSSIEYQLYKRFIYQYFLYYPKNFKNFLSVLYFFPFSRLSTTDCIKLFISSFILK